MTCTGVWRENKLLKEIRKTRGVPVSLNYRTSKEIVRKDDTKRDMQWQLVYAKSREYDILYYSNIFSNAVVMLRFEKLIKSTVKLRRGL